MILKAVISLLAGALVWSSALADPYRNITVGLSGFTYGGKKLPDAYAEIVGKLDDDSPNQWLDKIEALGKVARGGYWSGMPHLQPLIRKGLQDQCNHYRYGKQASVEVYEACFAIALRGVSISARQLAAAGVTDVAKVALASPILGAEIAHRCGDPATSTCVLETLQSQAKATTDASGPIARSVAAWALASHLRADCDAKYGSPENPQPCSQMKSVVAWRNLFRPQGDAPAEGLPPPVPAQPGCTPRTALLEDTVAGCLNDGCGQADQREMGSRCGLLASPGTSPYASNRLKQTMTYLDADSLVFLTRDRIVSQLIAANFQATGRKLSDGEIPAECKVNPELFARIQQWPKPALNHSKGDLEEQAAHLTKLATGLVQLKGQGFDDALEGELGKNPALLPLDATGEFEHDLSLARAIDGYKAKPNRVMDLLKGTANSKTAEALKQICRADWVSLVNLPMARRTAMEIGGQLSRPDPQEGCKKSDEYPSDMQASHGKCMPWLMRCMFAQVTSEQKREMMGQMCMAASMAVAVVVPPAGFGAGVACAGLSTANHALARMDEADARKLAVVCTGMKPNECPASEVAELTKAMQHEIVAAGVDIVLQVGAPLAAGKVLGLLGKGLALSLPRARAILTELRALHQGFAAEEKNAGAAEGDLLAGKIEALFNDTGGVAADAKPKPKLELVFDDEPSAVAAVAKDGTPPPLPKPKPKLELVLQDEEGAAAGAHDAPTVAYNEKPTVVYPKGDPDPTKVFTKPMPEPRTVAYNERPTVAYPKADPDATQVFTPAQDPVTTIYEPKTLVATTARDLAPTRVYVGATGPRGPPSVVALDALEDVTAHAQLVDGGIGGGVADLEDVTQYAVETPGKPPALPKGARARGLPEGTRIIDISQDAHLTGDLEDVTEHAVETPGAKPPPLPKNARPTVKPPELPKNMRPTVRPPSMGKAGPPAIEDITDHAILEVPSQPISVPASRVPSPIPGAPKLVAPTVNYTPGGKTVEQLAREASGVTADKPLEFLGKGGMNRVYTDPADPSKVLKVFDRKLIWAENRKGLLAMAEKAKAEGNVHLERAVRAAIDKADKSIPPGDTVPPSIDEMIAKAIQRHRVLGGPLKDDIVPALQKKMQAEGVKVTLREGLTDVSDSGVCRTQKFDLGVPDAAGNMKVEAKDYLKTLSPESPAYKKIIALRDKWNSAMEPFNVEAAKTNAGLGLEFTKGGQAVGYDFGNKADKFGNVILTVDAKGGVTEIMVADY